MSLKTRLIILFITFTLVPLAIFGLLIFARAEEIITTVRIAQLNNIADLKKDKIETFFKERAADVRSAQKFRNIRRNLPVLRRNSGNRTSPEFARTTKELDDQLGTYQDSYGYLNVILADPQGGVVYASNPGRDTAGLGQLHDDNVLAGARKSIYFSDVFFSEGAAGNFEMLAMAPVQDLGNSPAGFVVLEINMEPIFNFIQDATGLGGTGEALIARKEGEKTLYLSPLKHDPNAALQRTVTFRGKIGVPAQRAVQGENGSGVLADYTGKEVIAAWRYIPSLRWGLVTKIDAEEAFGPVRALKTMAMAVGFFVVLFGGVVAIMMSRTFTRPIQALQQGAEAIAAGDLGRRVGTGARDEIGLLGRSFDAMTEALERDMTGRKKAEEEVRALNKDLEHHVRQLEESNRELEAFSYSVSHDLRSPLRSIDGFSIALLEDQKDKLDAEGRDYLDRIRGATQRMAQLIDDLLTLSRVARFEMKRERVDLSAVAAGMAAQLRKNDPGRSAEFVIAEGCIAYGDERLLTVVLDNLFANAWKFSEHKPDSVVEFGAELRSDAVVYFIKDTGAGFDMAYADKLFNPFQRLHKMSEFPGTGIGLATVKRIINRHGGRVWIESELNKGTTVYFTLG